MPKYEVVVTVTESRYYTVEAASEFDVRHAIRHGLSPDFVKVHELDYDVTLLGDEVAVKDV